MKTTYKIGTYKSGQQFAKSIFESENIEEVKAEFIRMFEATEFDPEGSDNEPKNEEQAWELKGFCEDTNHVAVYECEISLDDDDQEISEPCINSYMQGMKSNRM